MNASKVIAIYICEKKGGTMQSVPSAKAVSGLGLEGDRYHSRHVKSPQLADPEEEITLIESEAIEAVNRDENLKLGLSESRRNVVTQGVALNHLVGKLFRVGDVTLRGIKLCEPCSRLQKFTRPGMIKALLHRGGLRAQIVSDGTLKVGDAFAVEPQ